MRSVNCWLILTSLLVLRIMKSKGQYVCNDTYSWSNSAGHPCRDYVNATHYGWCLNGTYIATTMWTGGALFRYPEFNCCGCGKGWPLWFVPASGYTAVRAIPTSSINMTNRLMCNDTYRNISACTMKCKGLPYNVSVTILATMSSENFNQSTCTLDFNMENSSIQYILQIPIDNYLIYFTNWTTDQYNFTCINTTGVITSNMLCRYEVSEQPFAVAQCPSKNVTSRYIPPNCVDTKNWTDTAGYSCFEYEITQRWCLNGQYTSGRSTNCGALKNYPEQNCCACGKEALAPIQSTSISTKNNSINSSEIGIMLLTNCTTLINPNYRFNIQCLAPLNFINTNTTMNATLYNCPLDCFFNWNSTQIVQTQSINISHQLYGSSFVYYLTSNLIPYNQIVCESFPVKNVTPFQSTLITNIPSTSEFRSTTKQPIAWQPPNCTNGRIGLNCSISIDTCSMTKPCLNNGTCLNTNSSFICLCLPFKFTGVYCETDIRPCKPQTCLTHGICIETNATSFICQCEPGYEGIHCESLINYCHNITCQNSGQCRPTPLNFTCECASKDYSGRYCEIKSSSLTTKQTIKRSFGYIAIIGIAIVLGIIVSMDVLKYVFNIDPVDKERKRIQVKKQQRLKKRRPIAIRFIYVNKPELESITEEP